ncbi:hypothetical protein DNTS_024322 [Danionella cerebrum]|uniref:SH3 domain-containing protein n=1 Tax=Danionella cerebrum TaxID=2873325 RepID=A0A553NLM2_9TELE|nr:hypothetical protein DNTS_024322 [Danionella translucida]
MQQIYTQNHEDFEVYTTVLSPQVCRRVIIKHQGEMMVVGTDYCTDCEEEVCVRAGEVVLMLYQENTDWCYVRLQNGREGYLPTVCFSVRALTEATAASVSVKCHRITPVAPAISLSSPST